MIRRVGTAELIRRSVLVKCAGGYYTESRIELKRDKVRITVIKRTFPSPSLKGFLTDSLVVLLTDSI